MAFILATGGGDVRLDTTAGIDVSHPEGAGATEMCCGAIAKPLISQHIWWLAGGVLVRALSRR